MHFASALKSGFFFVSNESYLTFNAQYFWKRIAFA
jgi:hypothetical protein